MKFNVKVAKFESLFKFSLSYTAPNLKIVQNRQPTGHLLPGRIMAISDTNRLRPPCNEGGTSGFKILDAAAEIISDISIEKLTIQELAKRSGTAPGSLYHFFPDIESVKASLKLSFDNKLSEMLDAIKNKHVEQDWCSLPAGDLINTIFQPYANFLIENKAYLPLLLRINPDFTQSKFLAFLIHILECRIKNVTKPEIIREANFLHSLAIGTLQQAFQRDNKLPYEFIPKILHTLALYLESTEVQLVKSD
jgi:AcrR family transcriptional regulator